MSRGIDRDDFEREQEQTSQSRMPLSQGRGGASSDAGVEHPQRRGSTERPAAARGQESRRREEFRDHGRVFHLSQAELGTMRDIGRFRTIGEEDLLRFRYEGNAKKFESDYRNLKAQELIERKTVSVGRTRKPLPVYALTREGKQVLKDAALDGPEQSVYAGFVKPAEVVHDAAIYRMYHAEADRIESQGGRVQRVVLDFELKRKVYSPLAKAHGLDPVAYAQRQAEVAAANNLTVVDGKIPLPDLRIEYEGADGEQGRVDLELATEHYRSGQIAEKSRAGFKMYSFVSTSRGSRAEWEGRELTAGALAL